MFIDSVHRVVKTSAENAARPQPRSSASAALHMTNDVSLYRVPGAGVRTLHPRGSGIIDVDHYVQN